MAKLRAGRTLHWRTATLDMSLRAATAAVKAAVRTATQRGVVMAAAPAYGHCTAGAGRTHGRTRASLRDRESPL